MSKMIDNLIAYRILTMLVTPFVETDAFKLGLIDAKGKKLRDPKTSVEEDAYDYLSRLVFNLKRMLNKLPGGDTKFKNIIAALFLIKEQYRYDVEDELHEDELLRLLDMDMILAEETLEVLNFFKEEGEPANVSMPADGSPSKVSTDVPAFRKKKPPVVKRVPPIN